MVFKNEAQLKAFLLKKCQSAVVAAEEKVHKIIDNCLQQFYSEFEPEEYIRMGQLLHSLVRSGVESTGNGYKAKVYFDVKGMHYQTGQIEIKSTALTGRMGHATWDAQKVLDVAMTGGAPHGGYANGTAIWSVSMARLGDIETLLVQELQKQGIPIA